MQLNSRPNSLIYATNERLSPLEIRKLRRGIATRLRRTGLTPPDYGESALISPPVALSIFNRLHPTPIQLRQMLLHRLEPFGRMALPLLDLADHPQRLARAIRLGRVAREFCVGDIGVLRQAQDERSSNGPVGSTIWIRSAASRAPIASPARRA